ncbi:MAG: hypothetical protein ACYTEX_25930 [Planctomycetota bacterium]|jgi:hypothetical protein
MVLVIVEKLNIVILAVTLGVCFTLSCGKKNGTDDKAGIGEEQERSTKKALLESLEPGTVLVENGQAAVVKIHEGYLFVVPRKADFDTGNYRVFFSQSGRFGNDAEFVAEGPGQLSGMSLELKGHVIMFTAGSATSVFVGLSILEDAGIAKYESDDPNSLDASKLEYQQAGQMDEDAFKEFVEGELERLNDEGRL